MSAVELAEVVVEVKRNLEAMESRKRQLTSTLSVPKTLLKNNEAAYIPQIVSFGPYHFGEAQVVGMERYKTDGVSRFIARLSPGNDFITIAAKMLQMEDKIRDFYDKDIRCKGEDLAWMMSRDVLFLSEMFRTNLFARTVKMYRKTGHFVPQGATLVWIDIEKDIVKLQNQVPLFLWEEILGIEMPPDQAKVKLVCSEKFLK
eukprot:Gb_23451 [translate_table: standard]